MHNPWKFIILRVIQYQDLAMLLNFISNLFFWYIILYPTGIAEYLYNFYSFSDEEGLKSMLSFLERMQEVAGMEKK